MLFRKKKPPQEEETPELYEPLVDPQVLEILDRLEKAGVQVTVRLPGADSYTTSVVGLGRDAFFLDTLSPPEGDQRVQPGLRLAGETLFQGIRYTFEAAVIGRVRFVDELPAFKVEYPASIAAARRRKSPRLDTAGDASLSFLKPFACDAPVVNLSDGGLAFEHGAELGRLRRGVIVRDVLLELGAHPVITVQGKVVGQVVIELGGLGLPRRYRVSLAFQGLGAADRQVIEAYLGEIEPRGFRA